MDRSNCKPVMYLGEKREAKLLQELKGDQKAAIAYLKRKLALEDRPMIRRFGALHSLLIGAILDTVLSEYSMGQLVGICSYCLTVITRDNKQDVHTFDLESNRIPRLTLGKPDIRRALYSVEIKKLEEKNNHTQVFDGIQYVRPMGINGTHKLGLKRIPASRQLKVLQDETEGLSIRKLQRRLRIATLVRDIMVNRCYNRRRISRRY